MKLKELNAGDRYQGIIGVLTKTLNSGKDNSVYIRLTVGDSSGCMEALLWQAEAEIYNNISEGQPLKLEGTVSEYRGKRQLNIEALAPVTEKDNFLPESLMPESKEYTLAELKQEFERICKHWITTEDRRIIDTLFENKTLKRLYQAAPAGMQVHHTAKHGLFAHSLSVARRCAAETKNYRAEIDKSLLITGALLHDIGKAYELDWGAATVYSTTGKLYGHIYIGARLVETACKKAVIPQERTRLLVHMILSHHGKREHGAIQPPQTIEANILYYCDNLDAKLERMKLLQELAGGYGWSERDYVFDNNQLYFGGEHEERN